MDTIISRMMQLLGAIVVGGMVYSGIITAELKDWGGCIAFLVFASIAAGFFTLLWTTATYDLVALIGKNRKRSDITDKSIVSASVGILALFIAVGFVTAGICATNGTDNTYSLWLQILGAGFTCFLCFMWTLAEKAFISRSK